MTSKAKRPKRQEPQPHLNFTKTRSLEPRTFPRFSSLKPFVEPRLALPVRRRKRGDPP